MPRLSASGRNNKLSDNKVISLTEEIEIDSDYETKSVPARGRKKIKPVNDEIGSLISSSSRALFFNNVPGRMQTKRGIKGKNAVQRSNKKLASDVFETYLEKLWTSFSEDKRSRFAYLDCIWFSLYRIASSKDNVLTWIKKQHIFSKDYVFVPIVCWGHWSLLIFCHFGESLQSTTKTRCMLLLDSLERANPRRLEPEIRKFVLDIYKAEGRPETMDLICKIPLLVPQVPQQRDNEECGNFVLYFINLFLEHAPENFSMEGYPYFMKKNWFTPERLDSFCESLDSYES